MLTDRSTGPHGGFVDNAPCARAVRHKANGCSGRRTGQAYRRRCQPMNCRTGERARDESVPTLGGRPAGSASQPSVRAPVAPARERSSKVERPNGDRRRGGQSEATDLACPHAVRVAGPFDRPPNNDASALRKQATKVGMHEAGDETRSAQRASLTRTAFRPTRRWGARKL
uniref:Uncharacterized protein n=1 Tax=Trichuris muris TaxID=70415 RepID=A0A5S6QKI8_TRIMR